MLLEEVLLQYSRGAIDIAMSFDSVCKAERLALEFEVEIGSARTPMAAKAIPCSLCDASHVGTVENWPCIANGTPLKRRNVFGPARMSGNADRRAVPD